MNFRLPLWLYWLLAGLGVLAAIVFTVQFDFDAFDSDDTARLLFTVWGGPLTLVIAATLATLISRNKR